MPEGPTRVKGAPRGVRRALGPRGHPVRRLVPFFRHKKNYLNPTPLVSSPAIPYHATFIYPPNQKEKPYPSKPCNKPPKPAAPFTF